MSLIGFHRFLIGSAIVFCFGFAAWELTHYFVAAETEALLMGLIFIVFGVLLSVYLKKLRSFLGQEEP